MSSAMDGPPTRSAKDSPAKSIGVRPLPLAWVGGALGPLESASIPFEDRGFLFGEAVYEVVLTRGRRAFRLSAHLERLRRSAAGAGLDVEAEAFQSGVQTAIDALLGSAPADEDALLYLQVTGGTAPRDHLPPTPPPEPRVYAFLRRYDRGQLATVRAQGIELATCLDRRWALATYKTTQLLPNVLAKREAQRSGADEVILLTEDGQILEGASCNLFVVIDGVAWTPPTTSNILPGITREILLQTFPQGCREVELPVTALRKAQEVFITSTTRPVIAVRAIDGFPVSREVPGSVTRRCADALDALMDEELGA